MDTRQASPQRAGHRTEPDHEITSYPPGIPFIIGNEGCERFSYYGMRAILKIYILGLVINYSGLMGESAEARANEVYHLFGAAVYAVPMLGALLADRLIGKYNSILYLSIVYCLGHLALALFESPEIQLSVFGTVLLDPWDGLILGLGLIALGSGGIKPCVSAHVGDQFGRGNWSKLPSVYNAFYFIINFGSFFSTIIIPEIRGELLIDPVTGYYSYANSVAWAFAIPGILMGIATIFFWAGRRRFVHIPARPAGLLGLLDVLSGVSLFMVFAYPAFIAGELETTALTDWLLIASFFGGFLGLFSLRQKRAVDSGGFLVSLVTAAFPRLFGAKRTSPGFFSPTRDRFGPEAVDSTVAVLRVVGVFLMVTLFWALFDQHASIWVTQARDMDREVNFSTGGWVGAGAVMGLLFAAFSFYIKDLKLRRVVATAIFIGVAVAVTIWGSMKGSFTIGESQIQALNPLMVMLLIPLTQKIIYPWLERIGFNPHPLRRMTVGLYMAALSFVVVGILQLMIDESEAGSIHVAWQILPYFIITMAEVMVSITGLEFGYSQAPKRMKSVIMGFWLLTVSFGNLLAAKVLGHIELGLFEFFLLFAGLMAVAGVIFHFVASRYRYQDVTQ